MDSYRGSILRVNLSTGRIKNESLRRDWAAQYFGGRGLGIKYLFEELAPGTPPLGPDNKLIMMTGPFAGTCVPTSGKLAIVTKSPATGAALDSSIGGSAAAELKYAGFDAIIVEGRAEAPVCLIIDHGGVSLESAGGLWGRGAHETEFALRKKYGDEAKIVSIGPAGENQVPYACITSELYRQAGRGGAGAVMGSKKLKAVVIRGAGDVDAADMAGLVKASREALTKDVLTDTNLWTYTDGTPMIVELSQNTGLLPTRNFQQGTFEGWEGIRSEAVQAVRQGKKACTACGLGCGNYVRAGGAILEGPEYETLSMAGSNCGIGDLEAVVRFNSMCDDLGLDTISAGSAVAFAMELTEKGIHDFKLTFGDVDAYLKMPPLIASRTGIGLELAEGVRWLAGKYGGKEFAMQVKGLELPGYDPRGSWGMGLAYATAPRGGCHMSAWTVAEEAYGQLDPFTIEGKARLVYNLQNYTAVKFSLIVCDFWAASLDRLAGLLTLALGREFTAADLEKAGERIFNLARQFNVREGFSSRDDKLPSRILHQPLPTGVTAGKVLPEEEFEKMLQEYYAIRGWDQDGRPTPEKLWELGIS